MSVNPTSSATSFGPRGFGTLSGDGFQQRYVTYVDGTPEGVLSGDPGALAWDFTNSKLYHKATGFAQTGWSAAVSQTTGAFTDVTASGNVAATGTLTVGGGTTQNGATLVVQALRASTTCNSGATTQSLGALPNGIVLGVTTLVTTILAGSGGFATFSIGDATTADKWGTSILKAAGTATTTASFKTKTAATAYSGGELLTITSDTGNFTSGVIESVVYYISLTAPTT